MGKINVGIFAGRKHHADKLMPLYKQFIADGHNAEFFYTANSVNIDPPAEFLLNTDVNSFDLRQLAVADLDVEMLTAMELRPKEPALDPVSP